MPETQEYTTIRVSVAEFEQARERKEAAGQTWGEYLTDERRGVPDAEAIADAVAERLEGRDD
jgi:ubiquinone biosynthesis protein UbiJ